ncbi:MAG: hypothetical protein JNL28_15500 [Planctomycetes bacterium]|nr:hypothetical protein [Planctomycetota bacterium]
MSERSSQASELPRIVAWLVLAVALFFSVERLGAGVDLEDEATHIAIPYRFVLGDRPFVDEINPIQTAAFITQPLIWAYVQVTRGTEGIVLFTRIAYLLACIGAAFIAVKHAREFVGVGLAALCAAPIVVQMPGIPNLGYHTLASLGFTAGAFAVAHGLQREQARGWIFAGGILHALAAVAIQVYFFAGLVFAVAAVVWLSPGRSKRALLPYAVGALVTGLALAPQFLDLGSETISYAYRHTMRDGTWWFKVQWVFANQIRMIPHKLEFGIALAALLAAARLRWKWPGVVACLALPVIAWQERGAVGANIYTTVLAMTAPFLFLALRDKQSARKLFFGLWLPSFVSGLGLAWASSVHVLSEGYAQLPACIVTSILAIMLLRELAPERGAWTAALWTVIVIGGFILHQRRPYNDDALHALDTRITSGPWKGIATTRAKAEYLYSVQADVERFTAPDRRVMFFTHFPAGYLMSAMRPAASSVWAITCPGEPSWDGCADRLEHDLDRYGAAGVVVFDMKSTFHTQNNIPPLQRGPAHRVLEKCLERVHSTPAYDVYMGH